MPRLVCEGRLDFLSASQKAELTQDFQSPRTRAMPHELAVSLGLERFQALIILTVLEEARLSHNKLLVYHKCSEVPVGAIPYGKGFPNLPWVCPECEESIVDVNDLHFDFMAITTDSIEFV